MNDIQGVLKEMDLFLEDSTYIPDVDEWKAVIEAAMRKPVGEVMQSQESDWVRFDWDLPSRTKLFTFPPDAAREIESLKKHAINLRLDADECALENERLESVVTDTDAAMYEANAEMERLREICDDLYSDKERLREALERMTTDCMESDFNEHWDTFKNAEAVLAEKEDKT